MYNLSATIYMEYGWKDSQVTDGRFVREWRWRFSDGCVCRRVCDGVGKEVRVKMLLFETCSHKMSDKSPGN